MPASTARTSASLTLAAALLGQASASDTLSEAMRPWGYTLTWQASVRVSETGSVTTYHARHPRRPRAAFTFDVYHDARTGIITGFRFGTDLTPTSGTVAEDASGYVALAAKRCLDIRDETFEALASWFDGLEGQPAAPFSTWSEAPLAASVRFEPYTTKSNTVRFEFALHRLDTQRLNTWRRACTALP